MHSPDLERVAHVIADNVVSAVIRDPQSPLRDTPSAREAAATAIMVEVLRILPTEDSDRLAQACNRGLGELMITEASGPVVTAVNPGDGSVTMRQG
ncbi:hypothetical protein CIW48_15545 [Methylobacterium sp. P1-11]|nr:hypothetical protein CIW48_15545 [Methylobacterium sp. P1-11]